MTHAKFGHSWSIIEREIKSKLDIDGNICTQEKGPEYIGRTCILVLKIRHPELLF